MVLFWCLKMIKKDTMNIIELERTLWVTASKFRGNISEGLGF